MLYTKIIRPILFKTDPERIHHFVIGMLGALSLVRPFYFILKKLLFIDDKRLHVRIGNIELKNPVGLAAGFDKNIEAPLAYPMLGFGWAELGSVTNSAQPGNPKPRLWRIPQDKGLIVYYGLSNCGSVEVARRMKKKLKKRDIPFGISIAPTTGVDLKNMADNYLSSFEKLYELADYVTLNVSCPNVAACDIFGQVSFIKELLEKISSYKKAKQINLDIFVKIGPDMPEKDLNTVIDYCMMYDVTAIIATNLIKDRSKVMSAKSSKEKFDHPGGVSGQLLHEYSNNVIRHIHEYSQGKIKIIGVGGIFTAEDAFSKLEAGASAVQLITGFIYGGPFAIRNINKGLIKILEEKNIQSLHNI